MTNTPAPYDIPFALPDIGEREVEAMSEALRSGWVTTGPVTSTFENAFREHLEADVTAIAVNSATAGLHLVLEACGIGPGDEVILPTWTFTATAEVVRYLGATPVLVDVDSTTYNMDLSALDKAITGRTKAIIPVHMAGRSVDVHGIARIIDSRPIRIVEDAAHAIPSSFDGRTVGQLNDSDAAVFSFYATKPITTGEGGMIVVADEELSRRIRIMRLHGIDRDVFSRYSSTQSSWAYDVVAPGFKYNLTDTASAIGLVQLSRSSDMHSRRESIAARYLEGLKHLPLVLPAPVPIGHVHSWHLFQIQIWEDSDRDELIRSLKACGVGTSVHYTPLHMLSYWRDSLGLTEEMFPTASGIFSRTLSLPIYSSMSDAQVEHVIRTLETVIET